MDIKFKEKKVDDKIFSYISNYYQFELPGEHTMYFLIDIERTQSLKYMFKNYRDLISFSFLDSDEHNVTDLYGMFFHCKSLKSFDFGRNFNAKNVISMGFMFAYCNSLISVDFSNLYTPNLNIFQQYLP